MSPVKVAGQYLKLSGLPAVTGAHPRHLAPIAIAIVFTALNLRTAVASVPPLLNDIPLSAAGAGLLTTLPVVCMAAGSPVAPRLARRIGTERALAALALTIAAGVLLRLVPGVVALFAGTVVAGLGIALGNVLVPSLIKRDFPERVGLMTGGYTMAISASGALAAALTVPAQNAIGHGWRPALAIWAIPALVAAAAWIPWSVRERAAGGDVPLPNLWRNRLAWQVTAFMGLQSLLFYSCLSWLPALLRSEGIDRGAAGALLSVMLLTAIPTCLLVPVVASRSRDQRPAIAITVAVYAAGLAGLLVAPDTAPALWATLLGFAQGSMLALIFLMFGLRSPDQAHAAELSAMAQTVGYALAAAGPLLIGVLRDATGGWEAPIALLLAVLVPLLAVGMSAGRARQVG
jgi:CP family cyanate transporter-like MFS transporter